MFQRQAKGEFNSIKTRGSEQWPAMALWRSTCKVGFPRCKARARDACLHLENPPVHVEPLSKPHSLHLGNPPVHVEPKICMLSQDEGYARFGGDSTTPGATRGLLVRVVKEQNAARC